MNLAQLELKNKVLGTRPEVLASELVLERIPFIFSDDWEALRRWRFDLGRRIDVDPCDITITGSAAVGLSLSPTKGLRIFDDASDVDVAVISPYHFDVAWRTLRAKKSAQVSEQIWRSIESHRRNYVFMGCIACDQILSALPFAAQWMGAFQAMARIDPTEDRTINARIYRDQISLRAYQVHGLEMLKAELI